MFGKKYRSAPLLILFQILLGTGLLAAQASLSFIRWDYAVGVGPTAVAAGDFNGDSFSDLAVANRRSGDVSILIGNRDGTFQSPQNMAVGENPEAITTGDFNGDAILDLAVARGIPPQGAASILIGNRDGTFQPPLEFKIRGFPTAVATGDFNKDGYLDLALANQGSAPGTAVILLGCGDGTFQSPQYFPAGNLPRSVAVGDLNGDGVPDLAVANSSLGGSSVSILLGRGDGTFSLDQDISHAGNGPWSIMIADLNRDRSLDLITADYGMRAVSLWLGHGDGTFESPQSFPVAPSPRSLTTGDFNGDGLLDVAVAAQGIGPDEGEVSVLLGRGDGTFQPAQNFAVGSYAYAIAAGDFNNDGRLDLVVTNPGSDSISVLINQTPIP